MLAWAAWQLQFIPAACGTLRKIVTKPFPRPASPDGRNATISFVFDDNPPLDEGSWSTVTISYLPKTEEEQPAGENDEDITDSPGNLDPVDVCNGRRTVKASVLMQRLSYPTETVLSNKITKNRIVPIIQGQSYRTIRTANLTIDIAIHQKRAHSLRRHI